MKLWGGRFTGSADEQASQFNSSIDFDKKLYKQDIVGSIVHAEMLGRQEIITKKDSEAIVDALTEMLADIESGALLIDEKAEDIHSFIESELVSRIGDAGRRLHTGRSRNDQVALDMKMYVKAEIDEVNSRLIGLLEILLSLSKQHESTIMPGFTHMQKAQPITLAHHMMAYFHMFRRDWQRLGGCYERTDSMPLGSGALAATTYPIDRNYVRETLEFSSITENSLDAVADRDFCIEFVSCLSIVMMHLSRLCEEMILWSTDALGFVEISDSYATGSSIMPQKKNPDMAELIRGKTGRVYGSLMGLLTIMKGLPLAYNKDMQEDKEAVFDAADTVKACLTIFSGMLDSVIFNKDAMYESALGGYTNATDAADWLVKKGVTFRDAHEIIGKLVLCAIEKKAKLVDLPIEDYKAISDVFDETIYEAISVEACVAARNIPGGPAEAAIKEAIENAERFLVDVK